MLNPTWLRPGRIVGIGFFCVRKADFCTPRSSPILSKYFPDALDALGEFPPALFRRSYLLEIHMKKMPSVFVCLDDETISFLVSRAEKTIILASPAVSQNVASTIVRKRSENTTLMIRVIVDADAESLRLGFGDFPGLKILYDGGIEIRCQPQLLIGTLIVDERSWIFSPTPKIILEDPSCGACNAINITPSLTKWLMFAMAPSQCLMEMARDEITGGSRDCDDHHVSKNDRLDDEILDDPILQDSSSEDVEPEQVFNPNSLTPQIGSESLTKEQFTKIRESIEASPPKQFDHSREVLVYNGFLQFVEMSFVGGRLGSRTITLPDYLLALVDDPDTKVDIKASCRLFEHIELLFPEIKEFEKKVYDVRRRFTQPLGEDLGSVILRKNREELDKEIVTRKKELDEITRAVNARLAEEIKSSKERIINIFLPLMIAHPTKWVTKVRQTSDEPDKAARDLLSRTLEGILPNADTLAERMELRCTFKDVTWEMLNEEAFGDAIKACFPKAEFTKLYGERNTIGEKEKRPPIKFESLDSLSDDDWPDNL